MGRSHIIPDTWNIQKIALRENLGTTSQFWSNRTNLIMGKFKIYHHMVLKVSTVLFTPNCSTRIVICKLCFTYRKKSTLTLKILNFVLKKLIMENLGKFFKLCRMNIQFFLFFFKIYLLKKGMKICL